MSETHDVKNETTLASIGENPEANPHFLLFAVIVDISEPNKSEESSNYITRVKIIDPSFNYKVSLNNKNIKFHKYVHISIFSETPDTAPKIKFVGDIIRLRRFKFKYSERCELKAYEKKYSNWLIYSGEKDKDLNAICFKAFTKNKERVLNKYEEGRISDLRYWADHFFFSNSMRYITWWVDLPKYGDKNMNDKKKQIDQQIDLILKVVKFDNSKNLLYFIDSISNNFTLEIPNAALKIGDIIQLKCVDVTTNNASLLEPKVLNLNQHSSCLHIPNYFWDYRALDRNVSGDKTETVSLKKEQQKFKFLSEFTNDITCQNSESVKKYSVKKSQKIKIVSAFRTSFKDISVTPIAELLNILKNEPQTFVNKKFLIQGSIIGYLSLEPDEIIKKIYINEKKIAQLKEKSDDKKYRIIYHLVPLIKDDSLLSDQHLKAYILTNDQEMYMFDNWEVLPSFDDTFAWENVKENKIQEFIMKLNALKKPEYKVRFIVQLMMTKTNKFFFKVVDSIFLSF